MAGTITLKITKGPLVDLLHQPVEEITDRLLIATDSVMEDASSYLSEQSPKGVYGHMKSAWLQYRGTEVKNGEVLAYTDPNPIAPYAWAYIFGTQPAYTNPWRFLVEWVEYKFPGNSPGEQRRIAFFIGKKRKEQGSPAHDFVTPFIEENSEFCQQVIGDAVVGLFN